MAEAPIPAEQLSAYDVFSVGMMPMNEDDVAPIREGALRAKAVIFVAFASGTTPEVLNPLIGECTRNSIPVFIVSTNYARNTGVQNLTYGPHLEAAKAGATHLKDINVNHIADIVSAVRVAIKEGQRGDQLRQTIIGKFGTPVPPQPQIAK